MIRLCLAAQLNQFLTTVREDDSKLLAERTAALCTHHGAQQGPQALPSLRSTEPSKVAGSGPVS